MPMDGSARPESAPTFPRAQWLVGYGRGGVQDRNLLVSHLKRPRFVARAIACDDQGMPVPGEGEADLAPERVYRHAATDSGPRVTLCEMVWIDTANRAERAQLLAEAGDVAADFLAGRDGR